MSDSRETVRSETRATHRRISSVLFILAILVLPARAADLVVVEQLVDPGASWPLEGRCTAGSRLVRLGADGTAEVLTGDFDGACDPSISFDAREMLFAGRINPTDTWQIWKMDLETGASVRITDHPGNAFAPLWVGSVFHLDDAAPTRRIAYLAVVGDFRPRPVLHTSDLDGSDGLRISFTPNLDLAPDVLPNGRIVYPTMSMVGPRHVSVMGLNIDGTDLAAFVDPHDGPGFPNAIRVGHDDRVYYVDSKTGQEALAFVSLRRPLRSHTVLAAIEGGSFLDPAPLSDGGLLVSFRGRSSATYELVRMDPESGRITGIVHHHDGFHVLDAQEIASRPVVPGRSTVVDTSQNTGVFFCISSHITDRPSLAHLREGGVTRLRVIESRIQSNPPSEERVLGEAPVEADGSFHIEVPAKTPLRFQILDAEGTVLGEQHSWTWVMPREWRGCIGCHEDREMTAPNILAEAVVKPAVRVGLEPDPPEGTQ